MNKFFRKFYVLIFVLCSVLLFSCADYLNDSNESSSSKLQAAVGIDLANKDNGLSAKNTLTVNSYYSLYWSDHTQYNLTANESKTVKFTISAGNFLQFLYSDSSDSEFLQHCSYYNKQAGTASFTISSPEGEGTFDTSMWIYDPYVTYDNTYTVTLNPSSSGYVDLYVYQIPASPNAIYTLGSSQRWYLSSSNPVKNFAVDLSANTSYKLQWFNSETAGSNYAKGLIIIYTPEGRYAVGSYNDSEETFTTEISGRYVLSIQLAGSSVDAGLVGFCLTRS